jgi:hypothetical protein
MIEAILLALTIANSAGLVGLVLWLRTDLRLRRRPRTAEPDYETGAIDAR